jgi:excisionase family DNA binding protein
MTLKEVAQYLRLSIQTLYKMVEQGRIPALKAGAQWRFRRGEVDEWMRRRAAVFNGRPPIRRARRRQD